MHKPHETWHQVLECVILGQMSTVVLDTQKRLPNKIQALGFQFKYSNLKMALEDLIKVIINTINYILKTTYVLNVMLRATTNKGLKCSFQCLL